MAITNPGASHVARNSSRQGSSKLKTNKPRMAKRSIHSFSATAVISQLMLAAVTQPHRQALKQYKYRRTDHHILRAEIKACRLTDEPCERIFDEDGDTGHQHQEQNQAGLDAQVLPASASRNSGNNKG